MAKTLGSWGTYCFYSGTNEPDYDGDSELRWLFQYDQNQSTGITTVYVQPFVKEYVPYREIGDLYVIPAISVSTTINGVTQTLHTPRVIDEYNGNDFYYAYGAVQTWTVDQSATGTGQVAFRGSGQLGGITRTASHTYTLPTINVTSTITNNTGDSSRKDFGTSVTFTADAPNNTITNTLTYEVSGTTYTIGTITGDNTLSYTFPTSLISSFPNTATPSIVVNCASSNGTSTTTTVYLNVPSTYKPSVALAIQDLNATTSGWGVWVQNKSILKYTLTPTISANSPIKTYNVTVGGTPYYDQTRTFNPLTLNGSVVINASVTDSRDRTSTTQTQTLSVQTYSNPTFTKCEVVRCNQDGTDNPDGTYGKVVCTYSISSCSNHNAKSLTVTYNGTTKTFTLNNYSGTVTATTNQLFSGLSVSANHTFTFKLIDSFNPSGISQTYVMPPSYVLMSYYHGGKGITFGRIAIEEGFHCYMNAQFHNTLKDSNGNTISAPNNGILTIQKNGTTVKTFTANQSSNVTANITVPTKTSDLINDSGFTGLTVTQIRNSTAYGDGSHTYTNGADDYKFYIFVAKVYASNAGYNTAILPADLVNNGIQVVVSDEVNFVRSYLRKSGTDLVYEDYARNGNGYIQYIYGVK